MQLYTKKELFDACGVLFGQEVQVSVDFLNYLQPSGIKAAFRKKAFESHPDRASLSGMDESTLNERFKRVHEAYHRLSSIVTGEGPVDLRTTVDDPTGAKPASPVRTARPQDFKPDNVKGDHFYQGTLPLRRLMLGRYMYYARMISWQTLIQALIWQRQQYPTIGKLAIKWGLLSSPDVFTILSHRRPGERFGQSALRQGKLSPHDIRALLGRQRSIKPLFGRFFVKNRLFLPTHMERVALAHRRHNRKTENT